MNTYSKSLLAAAVFAVSFSITTAAQASGDHKPKQDHTCQGGHNCNTIGGGDVDVDVRNNVDVINTNTLSATGGSATVGDVTNTMGDMNNSSTSNATIQKGAVVNHVKTGPTTSTSSASATGGAGGSAEQGQLQGQMQGQIGINKMSDSGNSSSKSSSEGGNSTVIIGGGYGEGQEGGGSTLSPVSSSNSSAEQSQNATGIAAGGVVINNGVDPATARDLAAPDDNSVSVDASSTTNYEAPEIPVSTAYAPNLTASEDTCMGSTSAGGQGMTFGISFGTTWKDENCIIRKDARFLHSAGYPAVGLSLMCSKSSVLEAVKRAGTREQKIACGLPVPPLAAPVVAPVVREVEMKKIGE